MKIVSKTGFLLTLVFLLITAYLERDLLDCPHELYRCTNIIPAMPWYLFFEGVWSSVVLNAALLYLIGMYIDRGKIYSKSKLRFVTIFTFILNFSFGIIFIALGWFGSTYAPVPGSSELLLSQVMVPVGVAIIVMSVRIFYIKTMKTYVQLTAVTLVSILLWMIIVSSYDMFWGLIIYVLLMTPLLVVKFKSKGIQTFS